MRYQQYKNRMMKIRKVLDFFHRFRFVFLGIAVVIIGASIALDISKGAITSTTDFAISYKYGEDISFSGTAFMGNVTYEFRRQKDDSTYTDWSEQKPQYAGKYEARAKSKGNHGYKYSDVSSFTIEPIPADIEIKNTKINYGNDSPDISYKLLGKDRIDSGYKVTYGDLTKNQTTAIVDLNTVRIVNEENVDVTNCYTLTAVEKEVTFIKEKLVFNFDDKNVTYDGNEYKQNEYTYTGNLYYGCELQIEEGASFADVGNHFIDRQIKVVDKDGNDYTENYDISGTSNYINIGKANPIVISSNSLEKIYDGEKFAESDFTWSVSQGELLPIHHIEVEFTNVDLINCVSNEQNTFTYQILDDEGNDCSDVYQSNRATFGSINITKRPIRFSSHSLEATFDNEEKEQTTYEITEGSLAENEEVELITSTKATTPGTYRNFHTYQIFHVEEVEGVKNRVDVTSNYDINTVSGDINIALLPLKFTFTPQTLDYDGLDHPLYVGDNGDNHAVIDEEYVDNLPEGWTYDVFIPDTRTMRNYSADGYRATRNDVEYHIYDKDLNDMRSYYIGDNITFDFGDNSKINKVPLSITVSDYEGKLFDNKTLGESIPKDDLDNYVSSSGLISGDTLDIDYSNTAIRNTKDANQGEDDSYAISLTYQVMNSTNTNVTSNYDISFSEEDGAQKDFIRARINKRTINVKVEDQNKIYDGRNTFTPKGLQIVDGNIGTETISFNRNATYTVEKADCGEYSFEIAPENIILSINNASISNSNYIINFINSGTLTITKRDITISQTTGTSEYIYFDDKDHGVDNNLKEVTIQSINGDKGLLSGHTVSFTSPKTLKEAGEETFISSTANFGTTINISETGEDVTNNYNIIYSDASFHIKIIKKRITVRSNDASKIFDGSKFDRYPNLSFDQYYANTSISMCSYTVMDDYHATTSLDAGHKIVFTKTKKAIVDGAIDVGVYNNDFDWKVVDDNNNDVSYFYDLENSVKIIGNLTIKKASLPVSYNKNEKVYDGFALSSPSNQKITLDLKNAKTNPNPFAFIVNYSNVGPDFSKNFAVEATFAEKNYDNPFMATNDPYTYTATFKLVDKRNNNVDYVNEDNISIVVQNEHYSNQIKKRDITVRRIVSRRGDVILRDTRYISKGELAKDSQGSFVDKLYFGDEEMNMLRYQYTYGIEDTVIKRGDLVVTSCYNVSFA